MQLKSTQTFFVRVVHVVLREKETTILKNSCKFRGRLHVNLGLLKQIENQIRSVTKKPIRFLRLQGRACDWSKHNEHFRNIFSVHGFVRLSVTRNSYLEANLVLFAQRSPKGSNLCGVI